MSLADDIHDRIPGHARRGAAYHFRSRRALFRRFAGWAGCFRRAEELAMRAAASLPVKRKMPSFRQYEHYLRHTRECISAKRHAGMRRAIYRYESSP